MRNKLQHQMAFLLAFCTMAILIPASFAEDIGRIAYNGVMGPTEYVMLCGTKYTDTAGLNIYDLSNFAYRSVVTRGRGKLIFQSTPRGSVMRGHSFYDGDWIYVNVNWQEDGYAIAYENGEYGYVDASYIRWEEGDTGSLYAQSYPDQQSSNWQLDYIGECYVVNCNEWVSLREYADTSSVALTRVPLGEHVYNCYDTIFDFYLCEYRGQRGFILKQYLYPCAHVAVSATPESTSIPANDAPAQPSASEAVISASIPVLEASGDISDPLFDTVHKLTAPFEDEEGYLNDEAQLTAAAQSVMAYAEELKANGIIEDCTYCEEGHSVAFYEHDGTVHLYLPNMKDTYGGNREGFSALGITTLNFIDRTIISGFDRLSRFDITGARESTDYIRDHMDAYSRSIIPGLGGYTLPEIMSYLSQINQNNTRVIFWRGHGGVWNDRGILRSVLIMKEKYSKDLVKQYLNEYNLPYSALTDAELPSAFVLLEDIIDASDYIAVSDAFFRACLPEVNGGLFYCGACGSFSDGGTMARAFLDKGFDAYVGASGEIFTLYSDKFMGQVAKHLTEKDERGLYTTIFDAMQKTEAEVGEADFAGVGMCLLQNEGVKPFRLVPEEEFLVDFVIKDKNDAIIEDAEVTIWTPLEDYTILCKETLQGLNEYTQSLPEGDYQGRITSPEYETMDISFSVNHENVTLFYTLTKRGAVSGRVVDVETGEGLKDVIVTAQSNDYGTYQATTDVDGRFMITNVPQGSYHIICQRDFYVQEESAEANVRSQTNILLTASIPMRHSELRDPGKIILVREREATGASEESATTVDTAIYEYNRNGECVKGTFKDSEVIYTYDHSQLIEEKTSDDDITYYSYYTDGTLKSKKEYLSDDTLWAEYSYNEEGHLTYSYEMLGWGNYCVSTYDEDGKLLTKTTHYRRYPGYTIKGTNTKTYTYDELNRLSKVVEEVALMNYQYTVSEYFYGGDCIYQLRTSKWRNPEDESTRSNEYTLTTAKRDMYGNTYYEYEEKKIKSGGDYTTTHSYRYDLMDSDGNLLDSFKLNDIAGVWAVRREDSEKHSSDLQFHRANGNTESYHHEYLPDGRLSVYIRQYESGSQRYERYEKHYMTLKEYFQIVESYDMEINEYYLLENDAVATGKSFEEYYAKDISEAKRLGVSFREYLNLREEASKYDISVEYYLYLYRTILETEDTQNDTEIKAYPQGTVFLTTEMTQADVSQYYGKIAKYTPASPVEGLTDESANTFRVFYIDLDGKYGHAGDIYLKADAGYMAVEPFTGVAMRTDEENKSFSEKNDSYKSQYSMAIVRRMHPSISNYGTLDFRDDAEEGYLCWMCDQVFWIGYADPDFKNNIRFITGGPSLDMFCDSYSAKYPEYRLSVYGEIMDDGRYAGQQYYVNGILQDKLFYAKNLDDPDTDGMYLSGFTKREGYYMMSPSPLTVGSIWQTYKYTKKPSETYFDFYAGYTSCFCPVVCLKAGSALSIVDDKTSVETTIATLTSAQYLVGNTLVGNQHAKIVGNEAVSLLSAPNAQASLLTTIQPDTEVLLTSREQYGFVEIVYDGQTGFVHKSSLQFTDLSESASPLLSDVVTEEQEVNENTAIASVNGLTAAPESSLMTSVSEIFNEGITEKTRIVAVEPFACNNKKYAVGDIWTFLPKEIANMIESSFPNQEFDIESHGNGNVEDGFDREEVAEVYKEGSRRADILIWDGHGKYVEDIGPVLALNETIKDNLFIGSDLQQQILKWASSDYWPISIPKQDGVYYSITPVYIRDNIKLDHAIVYLCCCHSGYNDQLADAFRDVGAEVIIYNKGEDEIYTWYTDLIMYKFFQYMCGQGEAIKDGVLQEPDGICHTVGEALALAKEYMSYLWMNDGPGLYGIEDRSHTSYIYKEKDSEYQPKEGDICFSYVDESGEVVDMYISFDDAYTTIYRNLNSDYTLFGGIWGSVISSDGSIDIKPANKDLEFVLIEQGETALLSESDELDEKETTYFYFQDLSKGVYTAEFRYKGKLLKTIENIKVERHRYTDLGEIDLVLKEDIDGFVRDAETIEPIEGTRVQCVRQNGDETLTVNTDSAGYFVIEDVKAGQYVLNITKSDYMQSCVEVIVDSMTEVDAPYEILLVPLVPKKVTVIFDPNGGECSVNSAEVEIGNPMNAMPTATRDNYRLVGWNSEPDGSGKQYFDSTPVTDNITLYAQWKPDIALELSGYLGKSLPASAEEVGLTHRFIQEKFDYNECGFTNGAVDMIGFYGYDGDVIIIDIHGESNCALMGLQIGMDESAVEALLREHEHYESDRSWMGLEGNEYVIYYDDTDELYLVNLKVYTENGIITELRYDWGITND